VLRDGDALSHFFGEEPEHGFERADVAAGNLGQDDVPTSILTREMVASGREIS